MKTIFTLLFSLLFAIAPLVLSAQWNNDPAVNTPINIQPGDQNQPKVATHPSGITYVSWFSQESGNYIVRLQKLDVYGNKLWGVNGIVVSSHQSDTWLTDYDMKVDNDTCAILVFQDIRTGNSDAFVYKISPSGAFLWGADGIQLTNTADADYAPQLTIASNGDAVVCWDRAGTIEQTGLQRIAPDGTLLWGSNAMYLTELNTNFKFPQVVAGNDGNVFVFWFRQQAGSMYNPKNIYLQLFNSAGVKQWANDLAITTAGNFPMIPFASLSKDGMGGLILAWMDDRDGNNLYSSYIQHVNADGSIAFPANGVEAVTTTGRHHADPAAVYMQATGEIFAFIREENSTQSQNGLNVQKFSPTGERLFTNAGTTLQNMSALTISFLQPHCEGDKVMLFFLKSISAAGLNEKLLAMYLDSSGNYMWTPSTRDVSSYPSTKYHPKTSDFSNGQWITFWGDDRNDAGDIYGQNMKPDGTIGPVVVPLTLSTDSLVFETYQQCQSGLPLIITNPNPGIVSVSAMDLEGLYPGGEAHWFIDPTVTVPFDLSGGESKTMNVKINVYSVDATISGYLTDTLNISGTTDARLVKIMLNEQLFLGIKNSPKLQSVLIYPNPAHDILNMVVNLPTSENVQLDIFNATGKKVSTIQKEVISGKNQVLKLNISTVTAGYYACVLHGLSSGMMQKSAFIVK